MKNTTTTSNGSTAKWKKKLIDYAKNKIKTNEVLEQFYKSVKVPPETPGIHLAIFTEPFLTLLLDGDKIVESRFSLNNTAPFKKVQTGDIVFIKKSGGDVIGYFIVSKTEFYHSPSSTTIQTLKKAYSKAVGANVVKDFWQTREAAKHISFLKVSHVTKIPAIKIDKRDRRAWLVLQSSLDATNELWNK